MKKLGYKILLFFLMVLTLEQLSNVMIALPYHWGNPWYSSKIEFLETIQEQKLPNTFFFGSSRVYRQIDPQKFDLTMAHISNKKLNSFNLGAPATFCPQTYYLYENFINSNIAANTRYAFIELMNIELINEALMHQTRTLYWQNLSDVLFVLKSVYSNPSVDWKRKTGYTIRYGISYLERQFSIGFLGQLIVKKTDNKEEYLGPNANGYYPLESELIFTKSHAVKDDLIKRQLSLVGDTISLKQEAVSSIDDFQYESALQDSVHIKKINMLIRLSEEKNIKLIFVLSPRNSSTELTNLYKSIPSNNKIELSNASHFPQLYDKENTFDIDHLNSPGSEIYSTLLAQEFYKILAR